MISGIVLKKPQLQHSICNNYSYFSVWVSFHIFLIVLLTALCAGGYESDVS